MKARSLLLLMFGCDDGGGAEPARQGHDGVIGGTWSAAVYREDDVGIDLSMSFHADRADIANTCFVGERRLYIELSVPVAYRYAVTTQAYAEAGDAACGVTLQAGRYDFAIVPAGLRVTAGEQTFDLAPGGVTDGLFGTWSTPTQDGSMSWIFTPDALSIRRTCTGLPTITMTAASTTESFIEFLEEAQEIAVDGDFECKVTANKRVSPYTIDAGRLTVTDGTDSVTFTR